MLTTMICCALLGICTGIFCARFTILVLLLCLIYAGIFGAVLEIITIAQGGFWWNPPLKLCIFMVSAEISYLVGFPLRWRARIIFRRLRAIRSDR